MAKNQMRTTPNGNRVGFISKIFNSARIRQIGLLILVLNFIGTLVYISTMSVGMVSANSKDSPVLTSPITNNANDNANSLSNAQKLNARKQDIQYSSNKAFPEIPRQTNSNNRGHFLDLLTSTEISNEQKVRQAIEIINERRRAFKRLAIVILAAPKYYSWANISISNKLKYSQHHGYGIYIEHGLSDPKRHPVWSKITTLIQILKEAQHEWIWMLDLDSLIMNGTVKADSLLDDNYDLIYNVDCQWFNAGSFFVRNSEWSIEYLTNVSKVEKPEPDFFYEQAALKNVLDAYPENGKHAKWVPQRAMNSFARASCAWNETRFGGKEEDFHQKVHYKFGDFVLHFPGHSGVEWFHQHIDKYSKMTVGFEDSPIDLEPFEV